MLLEKENKKQRYMLLIKNLLKTKKENKKYFWEVDKNG